MNKQKCRNFLCTTMIRRKFYEGGLLVPPSPGNPADLLPQSTSALQYVRGRQLAPQDRYIFTLNVLPPVYSASDQVSLFSYDSYGWIMICMCSGHHLVSDSISVFSQDLKSYFNEQWVIASQFYCCFPLWFCYQIAPNFVYGLIEVT